MKKRVLITGGNGFIGSSVLKYFSGNKYEMYAWGNTDVVMNGIRVQSVNLNDKAEIAERLANIDPDIIVHCAGSANVNASVENPLKDFEGNVIITYNILLALSEINRNHIKFIYLSSSAVYGEPQVLPITEEHPLLPISPYALHKQLSEEICRYFISQYDMDIVILRIFSAYGPGLRKQIFWDMNEKIKKNHCLELYGTGEETRDFIYIDDLIRVIEIMVDTDNLKDRIFNVANGINVSVREIAEAYAALWGLDASYIKFSNISRQGNPIHWRADISKLESLGYEPSISLSEGIERYYKWVNNVQENRSYRR